MRHSSLRHIEHGKYVRLECSLQLLRSNIGNLLLRMLLSRIVNQYVQPAKLVDGLLNGLLRERFISQITSNEQTLASFLLYFLLGLLRILILIQVYDSYIGALFGVCNRYSAANPAISTSN
ncbi:hypothetical protein D3C77_569730 [compost metagenome]